MTNKTHRIHRHNYENQFTILPNSLWENEYLSWGAKSLLGYLLSRPPNWIIYRSYLSQIYKGERKGNGKYAVDEWFKELIEFKYIVYTPQDENTGKFIHRYDVYPEPKEEIKKKNPKRVKPDTVKKPNGFNPLQISNDNKQTKKDNNRTATKSPPLKPSAVVVFSCLDKLNLPRSMKVKLTQEHSEVKAEKLVKRVLSWDGRGSDSVAVNTILKKWDEWEDGVSKQEVLKQNEDFLEKVKHLDGREINKHKITVGESSKGKYLEAVCGPKVMQFYCDNLHFIREVTKFLEERLGISLNHKQKKENL